MLVAWALLRHSENVVGGTEMGCSLGFSFPCWIAELRDVSQDNILFGLFPIGYANNFKKLFDSFIRSDSGICHFMHSTTLILVPIFPLYCPFIWICTSSFGTGSCEICWLCWKDITGGTTSSWNLVITRKDYKKLVLLQSLCHVPSYALHHNCPFNILISWGQSI